MQDTLFDIPETLSPRLIWMREHGIATFSHAPDADGEWTAQKYHVGESGLKFLLRRTKPTEEEALTALALAAGIKLWNEEGA
jgi:hypothetical protein